LLFAVDGYISAGKRFDHRLLAYIDRHHR